MPSTYTSSLKLTLPPDGATNWGTVVNSGITTLIDDSIAGSASIVLPVGSADRTLTDIDGVDDEARKMFLKVTGTPSATTNIICPAVSKLYFISNGTSPGFSVVLKTSTGTGITVPSGAKMVLFCDGTDVLDAITQMSSLALTSALAATSGGTGLTAVGATGNVLTSNGTAWTSAAPASTVAGSTTQVQYNNAGALAGSANFTFDGTNITVAGKATIQGLTVGLGSGAVAENTAVGVSALLANTAGATNTAIGSAALTANTTGNLNTAVGSNSMLSNLGGSNNTAIGRSALRGNTGGVQNTASGSSALFANTTGNYNTATGASALATNLTGNYNTAIGRNALNLATGSGNTGVGAGAGSSITTAVNSTAVGGESTLTSVTTAVGNTAVGAYALNVATGSENTAFGYFAGYNLISGTNNTCLGGYAATSVTGVSNEFTLGNSSVTALRCQVTSITSLSDARDKTNIQPLIPGLNFINRLNPVSFDWNMRDGGKVGVADTGFIAQDLQSCQSLTQEFIPGLVYTENPEKLEAAYGKLIPVLVKAIQELTARVAELEGR